MRISRPDKLGGGEARRSIPRARLKPETGCGNFGDPPGVDVVLTGDVGWRVASVQFVIHARAELDSLASSRWTGAVRNGWATESSTAVAARMPDDADRAMETLLAGVIDVLGVIAGDRCLHLPTDGPALAARRRDGGPRQRGLCGHVSGGVFASHALGDMPMCRNCMRIAANLVRADDWSDYRTTRPPPRPHPTRPRY